MIWLPHTGQPMADTSNARGTFDDAMRNARSLSSIASHGSASFRIASSIALAAGYFAMLSRARAISSSLNNVRRSFSGHCGFLGKTGAVVGCDDGGASCAGGGDAVLVEHAINAINPPNKIRPSITRL